MSIRFSITDKHTGEVMTVEAPKRGEYVKEGQRRLAAPDAEACDHLKALIKDRSRLQFA